MMDDDEQRCGMWAFFAVVLLGGAAGLGLLGLLVGLGYAIGWALGQLDL